MSQDHKQILSAIDRMRATDLSRGETRSLAGICNNCGRAVYLGFAFFNGPSVYCATEGCMLSALEPITTDDPK